MLKVLHISQHDNLGGSGRAAYRIHCGLKQLGVQSLMFVAGKNTSDQDVARISAGWLWLLDRILNRVTHRLSLESLFIPSSFLLPRRQWFRWADVIQLYNIRGYFSHTALAYLSNQRPIVWRLSDMWALTGHCIYSYECQRWQIGCGQCPRLNDYPDPLAQDTTALLWRIKNRVYQRSRLIIVTPSRWLARLAKASPLLSRFPIHIIPNGLNTERFQPISRASARQTLGLDQYVPAVLFSAHLITEPRKGGALLKAALERLAQTNIPDLTLLIMGTDAEKLDIPGRFSRKCLGFVQNDSLLAMAYSAADIFVFPTLAENLPNGVLESMACGTPAVAFKVGGVSEAVRHLETGYLAEYKSIDDLAKGIELLLRDKELRSRLSQRCREVAVREYSLELQAHRFFELYTVATEQIRKEFPEQLRKAGI